MTTENNSTDLNARISRFVESLIEATDKAAASAAITEYLASMSEFHAYSWNNTMLIWMHSPQATQVAGYKTWQSMGRQVLGGQKGIPILAPVTYRKPDPSDSSKEITGLFFKTVYVFDVSQTEGDPLPEVPNWKSPERSDALQAKLIAFATTRGITVSVQANDRGAQGVSMGGRIELAPEAGTKTLVHELAHELLHKGAGGLFASRELKELQAESVAYVVAMHFGLEPDGSPNYLALWGAEAKDIRAHFAIIQRCAAEIITALDGQAGKGGA